VGAQRSSASKRQRDIDKRSRAAEKRDRRQRRSALGEDDAPPAGDDALSVVGGGDSSAILEEVEQLHRDFEANVIDFDTYETRKVELLSRLQV